MFTIFVYIIIFIYAKYCVWKQWRLNYWLFDHKKSLELFSVRYPTVGLSLWHSTLIGVGLCYSSSSLISNIVVNGFRLLTPMGILCLNTLQLGFLFFSPPTSNSCFIVLLHFQERIDQWRKPGMTLKFLLILCALPGSEWLLSLSNFSFSWHNFLLPVAGTLLTPPKTWIFTNVPTVTSPLSLIKCLSYSRILFNWAFVHPQTFTPLKKKINFGSSSISFLSLWWYRGLFRKSFLFTFFVCFTFHNLITPISVLGPMHYWIACFPGCSASRSKQEA